MQIPNSQGQIRQINIGDYNGELWESFNLDLSTIPGKIKTSKQLKRVLDDNALGNPAGIVDILIWDGKYIVATEDALYTCSVNDDPTIASNWSEDSISADLDINSSIVVYNDGSSLNYLKIATNNDIGEWNGASTYDPDWWTSDRLGAALTDDVPHMLAVVQSQKETIYVTDGSRVQYHEKNAALTQIVELSSNMVATCLAGGLSGAMWVGTYNETTDTAYVYEIYTNVEVAGSTVYNQAYPVGDRAVLAIWVYNNTPFIVTETGAIKQFNGAGFTTIAQFPFKLSGRVLDGVQSGQIQVSSRSRPIHPRGVKNYQNYTYLVLNSESNQDAYSVTNRCHSGLWEFDHNTNSLTHKFTPISTSDQLGQVVLSGSGAILVVDNQYTFALVGCDAGGTGLTELYAVQNTYGTGWFTTPEVLSMVETDSFLRVIHKATIKDDGAIYTFYRTTKKPTAYATLNWISATKCTTTDDLAGVEVGELVRISHEYGAGNWAIIESIEKATSTYTLTVSKPIGAATEISNAFFDNFQMAEDIYTAADGEHKRVGLDIQAAWIQVMVILEGDIEYRMFDLVDTSKSNRK